MLNVHLVEAEVFNKHMFYLLVHIILLYLLSEIELMLCNKVNISVCVKLYITIGSIDPFGWFNRPHACFFYCKVNLILSTAHIPNCLGLYDMTK